MIHRITLTDRQQNTVLAGLLLMRMASEGRLYLATNEIESQLINPLEDPVFRDYEPMVEAGLLQELADHINMPRAPRSS